MATGQDKSDCPIKDFYILNVRQLNLCENLHTPGHKFCSPLQDGQTKHASQDRVNSEISKAQSCYQM